MSPAQHTRPLAQPLTTLPTTANSSWDAASLRLSALTDRRVLEILRAATGRITQQLGIAADVCARVKTPQSLAAKARRKGIAPEAVLDRLALRVCVPETTDCYTVFAHICDRWEPIEGSEDDYIAAPKANGYQSLHVAVRTQLGTVEFQVRTHAMNRHAEVGGAAHRTYKQVIQAA